MTDLHIHSHASHDSHSQVGRICEVALERGLDAVAVCDHADIGPYYVPDTYERFVRRREEIAAAKETYGNDVTLLSGIEMAEYLCDPRTADRLLTDFQHDVILGSVHTVPYRGRLTAYSVIDFSDCTDEELHDFLRVYFEKAMQAVLQTEMDVLCHLTCPLRYINGKYHRGITLEGHEDAVKDILSEVIRRGIALEVNTSMSTEDALITLPSLPILSLYRQMGGERITLGSDAHTESRVGAGFEAAREALLRLGFTACTCFQGRRPIPVPL